MSDILKSFLTAPESHSPLYLNEQLIMYTSNKSGDTQLWEKNLANGEEIQLTHGKERVFGQHADRDTETLVFSMDVGGNENAQVFMLKKGMKEPKHLTSNNKVRHMIGGIKGKRLVVAENERDEQSFDISVIDLDSGEKTTVLINRDHYNWPSSLSPDGRFLTYNKLKGESDNALWMVDTYTGQSLRIAPDERISAETQACWLPDSSGFYLLTDRVGEFISLAFYQVEDASFQLVKSYDWDVQSLAVTGEGKYLAVIKNVDGYSELQVYEREGMKEVALPPLPKGVYAPYSTMDAIGSKLLFSISLPQEPENIYQLDLANKKLEQLTFNTVANTDKDSMVKPQLLRFSSFDGLHVPFFLYVPKGKEASNLPVMIDIHGGPEGQEMPAFNPFLQYMLAEGIAVVAPNVRGSTGYGKTYTHLDDVEKRLDSVRDIEELVKFLVKQGIADEKRIGVMGVSYGGFMTLSCAARLPRLWACAIDTVGMFNLVTFLENTAPYRRLHRESEYGSLEKNRQLLYDVSPVSKVDDILAPLMVVHGANDPRVPVGEAEQVVQRLKDRGVQVEYLLYADEGHGISKLKNKLDCYPKMASFIKKHLKIS